MISHLIVPLAMGMHQDPSISYFLIDVLLSTSSSMKPLITLDLITLSNEWTVTIILKYYDNIEPSFRFKYDKVKTINEKFVTFDYYSVMIYPPYAAAIDPNQPTMRIKAPNSRLLEGDERPDLSKLDIEMIKKFYKFL